MSRKLTLSIEDETDDILTAAAEASGRGVREQAERILNEWAAGWHLTARAVMRREARRRSDDQEMAAAAV